MKDLQSKDVSRIAGWFSDCSEVWIPPSQPVQGAGRIAALFRAIFRKYQQLNWDVLEIYEVEPTHFFYISDSWGMVDEQNAYKNRILTQIRFNSEGKIIHLSDYFKDTNAFCK